MWGLQEVAKRKVTLPKVSLKIMRGYHPCRVCCLQKLTALIPLRWHMANDEMLPILPWDFPLFLNIFIRVGFAKG